MRYFSYAVSKAFFAYFTIGTFVMTFLLLVQQRKIFLESSFLNWPFPAFFVHFRPFLITISRIQIEKSLDGVLGIWTWGRRMVGIYKTMELWRPPPWILFYIMKVDLIFLFIESSVSLFKDCVVWNNRSWLIDFVLLRKKCKEKAFHKWPNKFSILFPLKNFAKIGPLKCCPKKRKIGQSSHTVVNWAYFKPEN